jgi:hypothetical protein
MVLGLLPVTIGSFWILSQLRKKNFRKEIRTKSAANKHPVLAAVGLLTIVPFLALWQGQLIGRMALDIVQGPEEVTGGCKLTRQIKSAGKGNYYIAERVIVTDKKSESRTLRLSYKNFIKLVGVSSKANSNDIQDRKIHSYPCRAPQVTATYLPFTNKAIEVVLR